MIVRTNERVDGVLKVQGKRRVAQTVWSRRGDTGGVGREGIVAGNWDVVAWELATREAVRVEDELLRCDLAACHSLLLPKFLSARTLREFGHQSATAWCRLDVRQDGGYDLPETVLSGAIAMINLQEKSQQRRSQANGMKEYSQQSGRRNWRSYHARSSPCRGCEA